MFAGAAREAVFARSDVIRRVNADFVPVTALAPVLNGRQGNDEESVLLRTIGRTAPAPQGICVLNSDGQPLVWSLMFDDEKKILDFLDLGKRLFKKNPHGTQAIVTQRFQKFPSARLPDGNTPALIAKLVRRHSPQEHCPGGKPLQQKGTLSAHVVGRALDAQGELVKDTLRQENYVEDEFYITPEIQKRLVQSVTQADAKRVKLPDEFVRLCIEHAYLGFLDLQPLNNPLQSVSDVSNLRLWAIRTDGEQPGLFRIEGESEVDNLLRPLGPENRHYVKLSWNGYLDIQKESLKKIVLEASGIEIIRYGQKMHPAKASEGKQSEVSYLPAGQPINLKGLVRFGIVSRPLPENQVAQIQSQGQSLREQASRPDVPKISSLAPSFIVFEEFSAKELNLSPEQRQKISDLKKAATRGLSTFIDQLKNVPPQSREQKFQEFQQQANKQLGDVLRQLLKREQLSRLQQISLQTEGLFALGRRETAKQLNLSEDQKSTIQRVMQETQRRFQALQKDSLSGSPSKELIMNTRKEQEEKIAQMLTKRQRELWSRMLGRPIDVPPRSNE